MRLNDFRGQIVRRTNACARFLEGRGEHSCNAQISNLHEAIFRQENVLTFKISMDDLPIMDMFHTQTYLREPVKYLRLRERSATLRLDPPLQVSTVAVVHDDAKLSSLRLEDFYKCHNVGMAKSF